MAGGPENLRNSKPKTIAPTCDVVCLNGARERAEARKKHTYQRIRVNDLFVSVIQMSLEVKRRSWGSRHHWAVVDRLAVEGEPCHIKGISIGFYMDSNVYPVAKSLMHHAFGRGMTSSFQGCYKLSSPDFGTATNTRGPRLDREEDVQA